MALPDNNDLDPALRDAVIYAESRGNPNAVSPVGAKGLMQLMDDTGRYQMAKLGIAGEYDPTDPELNVRLGSAELLDQLSSSNGDEALALAKYNYGSGKVKKLTDQYGESYAAIAAHLPEETQKYVPQVLSKRDELRGGSEASTLPNPKDFPANAQGFAQALLPVVSDVGFETLPLPEKAQKISQIYNAKNWGPESYDLLKQVMTNYYAAAPEEEKPDFSAIVEPPPRVQSGENADEVVGSWKEDQLHRIYKAGVSPAIYGTDLDKYLDEAAQGEKDAHAYRTRTVMGEIAAGAYATGYNLTKGALSPLASAAAAIPRLAGKEEVANQIQSLPDMLPKPVKDYIYKTDAEGHLVLNEDGTPQTLWQADAVQTMGAIGGFIAGGEVLQTLGVSTQVVGRTLLASNTLAMANDSFRSVKEQTGSNEKAYTAAAMTMPFAALGAVGELGIISKEINPAFYGMTKYDQYRYIASRWGAQAIEGGAVGAVMNAGQQGAEILQTGQPFSGESLALSAAGGAAGAAAVTAVKDVVTVPKLKAINAENQKVTNDKITSFRNGIDSTLTVDSQYIPKDIPRLFGLDVLDNGDGTTTLNKRISNPPPAGKSVPELLSVLKDTPSPDEVVELGKKQGELASKTVRTPAEEEELARLNNVLPKLAEPEHVNNIKAVEAQIATALQQDPGVLMARYDHAQNRWENPETGETSTFLKDLIFKAPEIAPEYTKDISDISHLRILDQDVLQQEMKAPETPALQEHQELGTKLDEVNAQLLQLRNQRDTLKENTAVAPEPIEARGTEEALNYDNELKALQEERRTLMNQRDTTTDKEAKKAIKSELLANVIKQRELQNKLSRTRAARDIEAAQNQANKESAKNKSESATQGVDKQIGELTRQARELRAKQLELQKKVDQERQTLREFREREAARQRDIKFTASKLKSNLGHHDSKTATISVKGGLDPEVKSQVQAHEIAHAITEKLDLSPETDAAVDKALQKLQDKGKVATAKEIAQEVLLPKVLEKGVAVPDVPASKLLPSSQKALYDRREFLANQVGAIILKRGGHDIGAYKILPEIESALRSTKLPELPGKEAPRAPEVAAAAPERPVPAEPRATESPRTAEAAPAANEPTAPVRPAAAPEAQYNLQTGQRAETALSETIREKVPGAPAVERDVYSSLKARPEMRARIEKDGIPKVIEYLKTEEAAKGDARANSVFADELWRAARDKFNQDPTVENAQIAHQAEQIRDAWQNLGATILGMNRKIRGSTDFADFISNLSTIYREAGTEPHFSDAMLAELKARFEKVSKLPESRTKEFEFEKLMQESTKDLQMPWGEFISNYMRTNLLSGLGTPVVTATSGFWMGPVVTALAHPIEGGGLIWRAMANVHDIAVANAKTVLEGNAGKALFSGAVNATPIPPENYSTPAKALQSIYNKFGKYVWRTLGAIHEYEKTLSAEGYIAHKKFVELKSKYGNDPAKLSAEAGKLVLSREAKDAALRQAENEAKAAGLRISESEKYARAYEILRRGDTSPGLIDEAQDWAYTVSHIGAVANPIQVLAKSLFSHPVFNTGPFDLVRNVIQPFGRAMITLSDYAQDFIPGNYFLDKGYRELSRVIGKPVDPRSPALQARLKAGQAIGTAFAAAALGLLRAGVIEITGEPEKVTGENKGSPAATRKDFKEYEQKGKPEFSVIFPNGASWEYKDFPGLNSILFGLHLMDEGLKNGESLFGATERFYRGAFQFATPFIGETSLNAPLFKLGNELFNPEPDTKRLKRAFDDFAVGAAKMVTPFSSFLRDFQKIYAESPEESHQTLLHKAFKDVPGVASLVGSQTALDRFGDPVHKDLIEHIPGIGRVVGEVKVPSDPVWKALYDKNLIVPEMPNTVSFSKSLFGSGPGGVARREVYKKDREDRLGSAYGLMLTPDEWNQFRAATGPYIKAVAISVLSYNLSTDRAQDLLEKRVSAIEQQALKRYVATGKFTP